MRIDEFEFRDRYGNEIEPTKNQLVIYIKSLHKQIKDLKNSQNQHVIEELRGLRDRLCDIGYDEDYDIDYFRVIKEIDNQIKELKEGK